VAIPLGMFVCITGVSGSGKSSLMSDVLYNALAAKLNGAHTLPGEHTRIDGWSISTRSSTSTSLPSGARRVPTRPPTQPVRGDPQTLCRVAREQSARLQARPFLVQRPWRALRGLPGPGRAAHRNAVLPDIYVPCDVCHGSRFNRETLQVHFKGHSIADVLDMTVDQALEKFSAFPHMMNKLKLLQEVGLGYVKIGQPGNTLSGGEAQRVKLAKELSAAPPAAPCTCSMNPRSGCMRRMCTN